MTRQVLASCVLTACLGVVAFANHQATFVLRNGDRVSGELSYKGGTSYTLNGRDYPSSDIALLAFVPGDPTVAELRQLPTVDNNPSEHERHVFVTRGGEVIFGKIYSISADGNTISYDRREGGRHDLSADQLARVYVNPAGARSVYRSILSAAPAAAAAVPTAPAAAPANAAPAPDTRTGTRGNRAGTRANGADTRANGGGAQAGGAASGAISVNGNLSWTDAGVSVRRGDAISFQSSGQIRIAQGPNAEFAATPDGSAAFNAPRTNYPVPAMAVGGLIARVDNGAPFPIGSNAQPILMPASGRLYLGVNDDQVADNSGAFVVSIRR